MLKRKIPSQATRTTVANRAHTLDLHLSPSNNHRYLKNADSCSFRAGAASSSETAIKGISRETPGAIYDPGIGGSGVVVPATRFSSADRFPVGNMTFGIPGPGHYDAGDGAGGLRVVSWTGVETFMDSEWSRSVEYSSWPR